MLTKLTEAGRISAWQLTMLQLNYDVTTVNYRYNVTDGTLKKLRYIRFYVIPVLRNFCKNTQNCVISVYRYDVMLVKTQDYVISVYRFNVMLVKTQNYLISVYR